MKWITRKDVKVDRVACPWLIRRFVRAADVRGQEHIAAEGIGLRAIAQGMALLRLSDQERVAKGSLIYDALLEYCCRME